LYKICYMKRRFLFFELEKYLQVPEAILVTGMRQVGKTTLLKQLFDSIEGPKLWFDLDNPLDQLVFEEQDYNAIFQRFRDQTGSPSDRISIFIDEIQNYPPVTKVVKYLIDHYGVKFYLTGSSNFYLKNLFPESLAGRKFLFVLPPLNFREYQYFKSDSATPEVDKSDIWQILGGKDHVTYIKLEHTYADYIEFGGFPRVVTAANREEKVMVLRNIFASFFKKDLRILSDFKDITELRNLILLLVPRVGSMLDITRISSEMGVERLKIYHYLEFLQGIFLIHLLPRFSKGVDRSVAGGKKVYFADTGLLNLIGKVNESQLFENAIINQLANYGPVSFYNHRNVSEIDAIVNKEIALEIKLRGTPSDLNKLKKQCEKLGIANYAVISKYFSEEKEIYPGLLV